jgi:hypothetical protein
VEVTAITFGSAAGNSGGDFGPPLPAAATNITQRIAQILRPFRRDYQTHIGGTTASTAHAG